MDEPKPITWNAGTEYNKLIYELISKYTVATLIHDFDGCVELLAMNLDLAYAKIYEESAKRKQHDTVEKELNKLRNAIVELRQTNQQRKVDTYHQRYKNYATEIKAELDDIRHRIWKLQGKYGVLYPQDTKNKKDPHHAMKHGFS